MGWIPLGGIPAASELVECSFPETCASHWCALMDLEQTLQYRGRRESYSVLRCLRPCRWLSNVCAEVHMTPHRMQIFTSCKKVQSGSWQDPECKSFWQTLRGITTEEVEVGSALELTENHYIFDTRWIVKCLKPAPNGRRIRMPTNRGSKAVELTHLMQSDRSLRQSFF